MKKLQASLYMLHVPRYMYLVQQLLYSDSKIVLVVVVQYCDISTVVPVLAYRYR